jgi:hypothetical protein
VLGKRSNPQAARQFSERGDDRKRRELPGARVLFYRDQPKTANDVAIENRSVIV